MLKIRVIPTMLHRDLGLVKGVNFDSWRRVGSAMQAVRVYNLRQVDELMLLDISATKDDHPIDIELVDQIADECFAPLTVGGGIRTIADVRHLLMAGADKVSVCTAAVENSQLVTQIAESFGSQCIVVAIDARLRVDGTYEVHTHSGTKATGLDAVDFARQVESLGAGEILLTSIDRDGTMLGYDIELNRLVSQAVEIPVIASGGAGVASHMADVLRETRVAAVAAASAFHFTELTPLEVKRHLADEGFAVRL
jgi:cyclase